MTTLREGPWREHALQLIGDELASAVDRRVDTVEDLARECIGAA
jgi:hypothetical protein